MPLDKYTALGMAGGLMVVATAVSNLWPLVSQVEGKQTMLHAMTSWALLPLGMLLALRDGNQAGVIHASSVLGSTFRHAVDLVDTSSRFTVFLTWAGLTCMTGFGGLYGFLAGVLCLGRALSLLPQVCFCVMRRRRGGGGCSGRRRQAFVCLADPLVL